MKPEVLPGTMYSYTAGVYCGVLMPERVMRKLAALQAKHLEAVRRLLHDNKDELHVHGWTLHHPNGVQTTVNYADTSPYYSVEDRIKIATTANAPIAVSPVFVAASMDEAKAMADARHEHLTALERSHDAG